VRFDTSLLHGIGQAEEWNNVAPRDTVYLWVYGKRIYGYMLSLDYARPHEDFDFAQKSSVMFRFSKEQKERDVPTICIRNCVKFLGKVREVVKNGATVFEWWDDTWNQLLCLIIDASARLV
jgi:hypothetical protein